MTMAINYYGEQGNVSDTFKQYQRELNRQREEFFNSTKDRVATPLFDDEF